MQESNVQHLLILVNYTTRQKRRLYNRWRPLVARFGTTAIGKESCIQLDDSLCNVLNPERIGKALFIQLSIYVHFEFNINVVIQSIKLHSGLCQANLVSNNRIVILNATRCPLVSGTMATVGEFQFQTCFSYFSSLLTKH